MRGSRGVNKVSNTGVTKLNVSGHAKAMDGG